MSSARSRAQVPWLLHPESPSHSSSLLPHRSFGSRPNVPRRACAGPTTSRDKDVPTANSGGLRLGISRSRIFLLGQPPTNPPNHQKKTVRRDQTDMSQMHQLWCRVQLRTRRPENAVLPPGRFKFRGRLWVSRVSSSSDRTGSAYPPPAR